MTHLTVMATTEMGGTLEPYHVNPAQIIAMRDLGSFTVRIILNPEIDTIRTPITEIMLPGLSLFASGVAADLLTRTR
jgi:hypothetical protein